MSFESNDENKTKRIKLSEKHQNLSSITDFHSLYDFQLNQILSDNSYSKQIILEGKYGKSDDSVIIILEKQPFCKDLIQKSLNDMDLALNLKLNPTVEHNTTDYACYPKVGEGDIKATVICPATQKHIEKYKFQPTFLIQETPELYTKTVLPYIKSRSFSLQWVYNILEHKSESDRIVFEDPNPDLGFILLPDMKSDTSEKECIYLIAIIHKRDIMSLRDLNTSHLPLLRNVRDKSLEAISSKYGIESSKLRTYFHYQPSYFHLHVHFTSLQNEAPGSNFERAHLLDTVISNIEMLSSFYQSATLTYNLRHNDPLYAVVKSQSVEMH